MAKRLVLVLLLLVFAFPGSVRAIADPLAVPNNRVGIHITDEHDLKAAHELVNSSGGDWGYVTLVIRDDQRDTAYWQEVFEKMRRMHLIPIVRIATHMENGVWVKPRKEEVAAWVGFLNSLKWVVQNRYIVLFNEPNHAKEWGGEINPQEYSELSALFRDHLKMASSDFFVMAAGLDAAASDTRDTMKATRFAAAMAQQRPNIYSLFDGLVSHSYPNPGFSGRPTDTGALSVRGYMSEMQSLRQYGLAERAPVFITETGWITGGGYSNELLASYYTQAYTNAWNNDRVVAVTPFVLNYQASPFKAFSWFSGTDPLPHYEVVKNLPKVKGQPAQTYEARHTSVFLPDQLVAGSSYSFAVRFENVGQAEWQSDTVHLVVTNRLPDVGLTVEAVPNTEPGNEAKMWITITTPKEEGTDELSLQLMHGETPFGPQVIHTFTVAPQSNVVAKIIVWLKHLLHPKDFVVTVWQGALKLAEG